MLRSGVCLVRCLPLNGITRQYSLPRDLLRCVVYVCCVVSDDTLDRIWAVLGPQEGSSKKDVVAA